MPDCAMSLSASQPKGEKVTGLKPARVSFTSSYSGLPGLTSVALWQAGVQAHVGD